MPGGTADPGPSTLLRLEVAPPERGGRRAPDGWTPRKLVQAHRSLAAQVLVVHPVLKNSDAVIHKVADVYLEVQGPWSCCRAGGPRARLLGSRTDKIRAHLTI